MPRIFSAWLLLIFLAAPTLALAEGPAARLSLHDALARGLERNFNLRIEHLNVPIGEQVVVTEQARFDPLAEARLNTRSQRTPNASALAGDDYARRRDHNAALSLSKEFHGGLDARLSLETSRLSTNSAVDILDPQYRSFLFLDLNQPLLRDFGARVNTADLRLADNRLRQARLDYLDQAQRLVEEIEVAYLDLSRTLEILQLRIEGRELARELLEANREKFEAGIVPVTEVQEAETAVAGRDEQVVFARQQVEGAAHRLRRLLAIERGDPLFLLELATDPLGEPDADWPSADEALAEALDTRPDLKRRQLEIVDRDIRLEFFANQKLPRLDLEASLGVNGLSGEERAVAFADGAAGSPNSGGYWRSLDRMSSADGYEWYTGVRLSYPLGNRAAQANHRRADLEKRQALYGLKDLENLMETEIRNALTAVERGFERVLVAERFQQLADTTLSQEMERLREGLSDTFRILDFQDNVIEARVRKTNALVDFHQGLAGLYRAMGLNLERRGIVHDPALKEMLHVQN
ncbi:TolC family protein [Geoalkalibacter halelectricus]|uniref:TolC family protein n=1 Tax=Geoalkalibacter halelectricus TaxID=2847045 RepID=A0ABY5ZLD4_9BACT|nr:TolC family protein [Geoalkalibacter halelectricus]MDO3378741.1 TolC family protein [Geoalkalibacter halelectricus]UWZ79951.1 TolC family protein [Geoalkalibacter halelectricus]